MKSHTSGDALSPPGSGAAIARSLERAAEYLEASLAPATRRAYRLDWSDWEAWCREHSCAPLPASSSSVAVYLADLAGAGLAVSTLRRRMASISVVHRARGQTSPCASLEVRRLVQGITRTHGRAQTRARPVGASELRAMLEQLAGPWATRDRAELLVGWSCAMRESEIVALDLGDLVVVERGLEVRVRRSKSDQEGAGETIPVPRASRADMCPVAAWHAWTLMRSATLEGLPAFPPMDRLGRVLVGRQCPRVIERLVRRLARLAGLGAGFTGHSLRAGYCTEAARAGRPDRAIMAVSRHRSRATLDGYVRAGALWEDVPSLL